MLKVKDLKEGMKVVSVFGTEFEVVGKLGRKYVQLKRVTDGAVWHYDNEGLEVQQVKVMA
ncbi:hypothetical protein MS1_37 [Streptococcus virus MS1]|nr:hypothetical protein MS1_37 [Streptococcus virus MS1]